MIRGDLGDVRERGFVATNPVQHAETLDELTVRYQQLVQGGRCPMNRHEALVEDSMFGEQFVTTAEEIEKAREALIEVERRSPAAE